MGSRLTGKGGRVVTGHPAAGGNRSDPPHTDAWRLLDEAIRLSGGDLRTARKSLAGAIELLLLSPAFPVRGSLPVPGSSGIPATPPRGGKGCGATGRPAIHIQTLGKFELTLNERPFLFPTRMPRRPLAVLKWLVAEGGRGLPVTVAAQGLWPDADDDRACNALNVAVHRLRRLLGSADAIVCRHGVLHLSPAAVEVDLQGFEDSFAQAQRERVHGRMQTFEMAGLQALSRVTGVFLPGEEPLPWVLAARHRIARMTVQLASALSVHLTVAEQLERAESVCESGLGVDPLSETLYQRLMEIQLHQGRCAEAVRAFARCRQLLHTRLGTAPSPVLVGLYQKALASEALGPGTT
ncbi:MAG: BTAD domain-containing putative transcriptional regulator [Betaproteobacteria bacterium]